MDENTMYTMRFADGTSISVSADGCGNWLSDEISPEMITSENISKVVIQNEYECFELEDQVCDGVYPYVDTFGFCLRDKTLDEKLQDTLEIYAEAIEELAELLGG